MSNAKETERRPASYSPRRQARLARKELRETLRDRRTIITLLLMPVLVYPLLSVIMQKMLVSGTAATAQSICMIAPPGEDMPLYAQFLLTDDEPIPLAWDATMVVEDQREAVKSNKIDLGIEFRKTQPTPDRPSIIECQLIYRRGSPLGLLGRDYVQQRLRAVNERHIRQQLAQAGMPYAPPITTTDTPVEAETTGTISLATLAPLVLILMTITGAVYPAIDLTAGERERGTLETLVAAPVPRLALLMAKYVAVLTVAMMTAAVNLIAMTVTVLAVGLGDELFGDANLTPSVIIQVLGLLFLFAAFFSAVLLALTSFARSFKEAQAYVIPLMLLSLAPALLSATPGLELGPLLAVTPLVNIVLLARDTFGRNVDVTLAAVVVQSTALYALAAITLAARVFGTDAILYGSRGSWSDLLRRPDHAQAAPNIAAAMFSLAVLFPAYFLTGNVMARWGGASITNRLAAMGAATAILFGGIPLLGAALAKVRLRDGFALRLASPLMLIGAAAMGVSLWAFAHEVFVFFSEDLGMMSLKEEQIQQVREMARQWQSAPVWLLLAAVAFAPAVFEEFFFRGWLMGSLLTRMSPVKAIFTAAVLFGAFHVVATSALSIERFLPSTLMGLALGWVRWKSGSVFPSMLLHACHNGLLVLTAYGQDQLEDWGIGVEEASHLPLTWLAAALTIAAIGVALVMMTKTPRLATDDVSGAG